MSVASFTPSRIGTIIVSLACPFEAAKPMPKTATTSGIHDFILDGRMRESFAKLQTSPAVPTRDARVRLPELLVFREVPGFWQRPLSIKTLDRSAHAQVISRKDIEPSQRENQKHLHGP